MLYYTEINGTAHLHAVFCGTVSQIVYWETVSTVYKKKKFEG